MLLVCWRFLRSSIFKRALSCGAGSFLVCCSECCFCFLFLFPVRPKGRGRSLTLALFVFLILNLSSLLFLFDFLSPHTWQSMPWPWAGSRSWSPLVPWVDSVASCCPLLALPLGGWVFIAVVFLPRVKLTSERPRLITWGWGWRGVGGLPVLPRVFRFLVSLCPWWFLLSPSPLSSFSAK